jgi:hypothetical protein
VCSDDAARALAARRATPTPHNDRFGTRCARAYVTALLAHVRAPLHARAHTQSALWPRSRTANAHRQLSAAHGAARRHGVGARRTHSATHNQRLGRQHRHTGTQVSTTLCVCDRHATHVDAVTPPVAHTRNRATHSAGVCTHSTHHVTATLDTTRTYVPWCARQLPQHANARDRRASLCFINTVRATRAIITLTRVFDQRGLQSRLFVWRPACVGETDRVAGVELRRLVRVSVSIKRLVGVNAERHCAAWTRAHTRRQQRTRRAFAGMTPTNALCHTYTHRTQRHRSAHRCLPQSSMSSHVAPHVNAHCNASVAVDAAAVVVTAVESDAGVMGVVVVDVVVVVVITLDAGSGSRRACAAANSSVPQRRALHSRQDEHKRYSLVNSTTAVAATRKRDRARCTPDTCILSTHQRGACTYGGAWHSCAHRCARHASGILHTPPHDRPSDVAGAVRGDAIALAGALTSQQRRRTSVSPQ